MATFRGRRVAVEHLAALRSWGGARLTLRSSLRVLASVSLGVMWAALDCVTHRGGHRASLLPYRFHWQLRSAAIRRFVPAMMCDCVPHVRALCLPPCMYMGPVPAASSWRVPSTPPAHPSA